MSDLSESLWYRDDHGQWHLVWGAVTRGNFVLWRGPAAVGVRILVRSVPAPSEQNSTGLAAPVQTPCAGRCCAKFVTLSNVSLLSTRSRTLHLVWKLSRFVTGQFVQCTATDNMLRASLRSLKVNVVEIESKDGGHQALAASRYSKCFQVVPVSGTWDSSKTKNAGQALYIAAVDATSHSKWEGALQVTSQANEKECSQSARRDDKQENTLGDVGEQTPRPKDSGNPASCNNDESGAHSSSIEAQKVGSEQQPSDANCKKEDVPRNTSAGTLPPESLSNALKCTDQKLSTVQLTGMDPEVAAVFVHRCPNLLSSVTNIKQELCRQYRRPQGCDLMVSVQALKMLHAIVLNADIESDRHNSTEGLQDPSATTQRPVVHAIDKKDPESSISKASLSEKTNTAAGMGDAPNTGAGIAGAAKCLHNLDYDISHLLTKLSVLSTADMSVSAQKKSAAMLLRDFCENTALVGNVCEVHTATIQRDDSMAGSSAYAASSGRSTMSGAVERDTHSSRQVNTADSSDAANAHHLAASGAGTLAVQRGEAGNDQGGSNSMHTLPADTWKVLESSRGTEASGVAIERGSGPMVRVLGSARAQNGHAVLQSYEISDTGGRGEREAENSYLSKLAKSEDTNRPLIGASRLPYMTYWMHARAI